MTNELKKLVKEIQYMSDKTLKDIAKSIGYSTAYFTDQVNKGENEEIKGRLERLLTKSNENEQNVPHATVSAGNPEKGSQASNKPNSQAIPPDYRDKIIALQDEIIGLERRLKEKQAAEVHLNEMREMIQDFLARQERRDAEVTQQLVALAMQAAEGGNIGVRLKREYPSRGSQGKKK